MRSQEPPAPHGPSVQPRLVGRGQAASRGPAARDRRRCPAAGRHRIALVWANSPWSDGLRPAAGHTVRAARRCTWTSTSRSGRPTAAGDLLLRRRSRAQTRVRGRRPARPAPRRAARRGRRRRRDRRRPRSSRWSIGAERRATPRGWAVPTATDIAFALARARRHQHPSAVGAAHVPAHAGRGRRPARHHHHRDLLHRGPAAAPAAARARPAGARSACWSQRGIRVVVAADPARRRRLGTGARLRASTPRSPACCSASPSRCRARPVGRTPAPGSPSTSSTLAPALGAVAVPVFAFFSAGVTVGGFAGLRVSRCRTGWRIGIVVGLVVGKTLGILGATVFMARFTRADSTEDLAWTDVLGLAMLAGVGFTVSLLIGELAFGAGQPRDEHVKVAVLTGSLLAALLAAVVLRVATARIAASASRRPSTRTPTEYPTSTSGRKRRPHRPPRPGGPDGRHHPRLHRTSPSPARRSDCHPGSTTPARLAGAAPPRPRRGSTPSAGRSPSRVSSSAKPPGRGTRSTRCRARATPATSTASPRGPSSA